MKNLIFVLVALFSAQGHATSVYNFFLSANDQVQESCKTKDGDTNTSKMKIALTPAGNNIKLFLKFKVCTTKFGLRSITTYINLPKQMSQDSFLSSLNIGASKTFRGISSAQGNGGSSDITVTRLDNHGTLAAFRLTWADHNNATPNTPVTVYQETDAKKLAILDEKVDGHFPWARVSYTYKQLLIGSIILDGHLEEKTQEDL